MAEGTLKELLATVPQEGELTWIGLRPARGAPVEVRTEAELVAHHGLEGDRYRGRKGGAGKRQVSLVQAEHLPLLAAWTGHDAVDPAWLRRNLVVRGINLVALKAHRFRIGDAVLEGAGPCEPCSKMLDALGAGGFAAMRGHGGIVARVVLGGRIRVYDPVRSLGPRPA
ncbi:MAG: MOSC domain-containing protein [Myxococcota bacterium]